MPTSHDQNYKNLILDYPLQALAFYAPEEAQGITPDVQITHLRQEMLKDRLSDRFFELDVPLLATWPDGRREALLFVLEEQTDPGQFFIRKLASYCLAISEAQETDRVVPVVIFLRRGNVSHTLRLGSEHRTYLHFEYLSCVLPDLPAERFLESTNLVARLNLVNMQYGRGKDSKVHAYGHAVRGLMTLEPDEHKRAKYMGFIDIYGNLDDTEKQRYRELYTAEDRQMMQWTERVKNEGRLEGRLETLADLLSLRFGPVDVATQALMHSADDETLKRWTRNVLSAQTLEEVFRVQ